MKEDLAEKENILIPKKVFGVFDQHKFKMTDFKSKFNYNSFKQKHSFEI